MNRPPLRFVVAFVTLVSGQFAGLPSCRAQKSETGPAAPVVLRVEAEVPRPLELTAEAFSRMPRRTVRVAGADGKEAAYEGVPVVEILQAAGVKFGHDLRGKALTAYLVVEAADDYRAVFALPELDPEFTERQVVRLKVGRA